jgi:hypothetical protein
MTTYPERNNIEKFLILNFLDIIELIGDDRQRMLSLLGDIRKELDAGRITNDLVVASDEDDTQWIFEVKYIQEGIYYLEFNGTAK